MIYTIVVGVIRANCYLVSDKTGQTVLIDPGDEPEKIVNKIHELKLTIVAIINTHGHFDHIDADKSMQELFKVPLMIHQDDEPMLNYASIKPDKLLSDGDVIKYGHSRLKVIHTPGHTPGGICLLGKGFIFTGDTLFCGTVGRCDLPGGDPNALIQSLKEKLLVLPDKTQIYPGHGNSCTIGGEKKHNPLV